MRKGFVPILILIGVLIIVSVAGGVYYFSKKSSSPTATNLIVSQAQALPVSSPTPDTAANWKTFNSKTEGFTIRYPDNWTVQDTSSGNCGHNSGTPTLNGNCRDRFDFISSDGLIVRYVIHNDENNDRISCGTQSTCDKQNVRSIDMLNVGSLGGVLLVKQDKEINLHKPLDNGTTPTVGANKHSNYMIDFSLPSKTGGRFALFVTTPNPDSKFNALTGEQFYNLDSVKQAILMLKSLSY